MSTKAQVKTQAQTPAAPAAARIVQPPVAVPKREAERPDIATRLAAAARLGHSFGAVGVDRSVPPIIQRQELPEEEEEELQLKREPAAVQRQELPEEEEEEELQLKREPAAVQRQEQTEEEEELMLKRDDDRVGPQGGQVPPDVEVAIRRARGGGQPLEPALQEQMRTSLGHDFSGVRVHTDSEADDLNQQLQARAFTTGPDIFFKRGAYDPASSSSRELIAHELSHVVQQRTGMVSGGGTGMTVRPAGDAFEQEADRVAEAGTRSVATSVQRQTPGEVEFQSRMGGVEFSPLVYPTNPATCRANLEPLINSGRSGRPTSSRDGRRPQDRILRHVASAHLGQNAYDTQAFTQGIGAKVFTSRSDIFFMGRELERDRLTLHRDEASAALARPAVIIAPRQGRIADRATQSTRAGGYEGLRSGARQHSRTALSNQGGVEAKGAQRTVRTLRRQSAERLLTQCRNTESVVQRRGSYDPFNIRQGSASELEEEEWAEGEDIKFTTITSCVGFIGLTSDKRVKAVHLGQVDEKHVHVSKVLPTLKSWLWGFFGPARPVVAIGKDWRDEEVQTELAYFTLKTALPIKPEIFLGRSFEAASRRGRLYVKYQNLWVSITDTGEQEFVDGNPPEELGYREAEVAGTQVVF